VRSSIYIIDIIRSKIERSSSPYIFLLPTALLVFAVSLYPLFYAVQRSFFETHYLEVTKFIGLGNYIQFFSDAAGRRNILTSLFFTFGTLVLSVPIGLGLALVLNTKIRGQVFFRTILLLPWIVSMAVTALLWGWIYNPLYGPINFLLSVFGGGEIDFLGDPKVAMFSLILSNVWRTYPLAMVLLLAALQTIPPGLYEAAHVDGATRIQIFRYITLPLIQPTVLITIIMLSSHYFNMVTQILFLTDGTPLGKTEVLSLRLFHELFISWKVGFAASIGVLIVIFNVLFTLLYIKFLRREEI
jgi:multiple sugar transport system permease protein